MSRRVAVGLSVLVLASAFLLPACQASEPAAPAAPPPAPVTPPPPPPPPSTTLGNLVKTETAPAFKARMQYLTINGLKSGVEEVKAESGKTFLVLYFENRPEPAKKKESGMVSLKSGGSGGRLESADKSDTGDPEVWLTDASGAKYTEWIALFEKTSGAIAFEVPSTAAGFVFHDGPEKSHPLRSASR